MNAASVQKQKSALPLCGADSVRFYRLGSKWETKIETMGQEKGIQQDEPMLL